MATNPTKNKRAGAEWETTLMNGLRAEGFDVERLRLSGTEDEGDLVVRMSNHLRVVIEAKAGAMHPAEFVTEAALEAKHYADHRPNAFSEVKGVAVVKRRGKGWKDGYVLTRVRDYFGLDGE